jgi:hypothetical protein
MLVEALDPMLQADVRQGLLGRQSGGGREPVAMWQPAGGQRRRGAAWSHHTPDRATGRASTRRAGPAARALLVRRLEEQSTAKSKSAPGTRVVRTEADLVSADILRLS